jgi:hypothetical protein
MTALQDAFNELSVRLDFTSLSWPLGALGSDRTSRFDLYRLAE